MSMRLQRERLVQILNDLNGVVVETKDTTCRALAANTAYILKCVIEYYTKHIESGND